MNNKLNKFLSIIFVFMMMIVLASCGKPTIIISKTDLEMELGSNYDLKDLITLENVEENEKELVYSYDEEVIKVENEMIFAEKIGKTELTIQFKDIETTPQIINITVVDLKDFTFTGPNSLIVGKTGEYQVMPSSLNITTITSSDEEILKPTGLTCYALKEGTVTLTVEYKGSTRSLEVKVEKDNVNPIINSTAKENVTISWNENFDIYEGITVSDNIDEDIKLTLKEEFSNQKMGEQTITYVATDSSGNEVTLTRKINIVWDYAVEFIGHAGSYYGIMNTEEAFLYAVEVLQYQLLECDLKQTKDGVFVLCHDDKFGGYDIANTNWSILKDVTETKTRYAGYPSQNGSIKNGGKYTSKICSLERYLEICKDYNVKPVIELKYSQGINNNDQSRMQALMDEIERCGMRKEVIFLGSAYNCLIWTRNNGYEDVPCQYLVNSCESEEVLKRCIDNKLDLSFNATGDYSNSTEWIAKYKEAGCKVSCYTFTQYSNYKTLQEWINKGVDYVTCDWQLMSKVDLPKKEK